MKTLAALLVSMLLLSCDPAGMMAALSVLDTSQKSSTTQSSKSTSTTPSSYSSNTTRNTSYSTSSPSLGYGETLVKTVKGVSVSYAWELSNNAKNNDGEMIYAWRITAYVRNHSGVDKSMGVVVIQPQFYPASLLPQGWYSGGKSFNMIDNQKMKAGDVESESLTIYTRSSSKPGAPIVMLNVWN